MFFWPIVVVAVVAGVVWYMRNADDSSFESAKSRSALEVLEERYARGEINREEYLQKRQDLETDDRGA